MASAQGHLGPAAARIAISLVVITRRDRYSPSATLTGLTERGLSESGRLPWPDCKRRSAMDTMYEYGRDGPASGAQWIFSRAPGQSNFLLCAAPRAQTPRRRARYASAGHDFVCTAIAGGRDAALPSRARAHPPRRRLHHRDDGRAPSLVLPLGPSVTPRLVVEEGGFLSTILTPTTTTAYWTWSAARSTCDPLILL